MELAETEREGASPPMKQHCITLKEGAVPLQTGKKLSMGSVVHGKDQSPGTTGQGEQKMGKSSHF